MDDSHVSMSSVVRKPNLLPSTLRFFGRIFRRDSPLFPLRYSEPWHIYAIFFRYSGQTGHRQIPR
jgi:hypothetical protein